ncbi:MAG: ABC transporter permease [Clostridiales bacterium]|jgi:ABC-2 type transport system permease protein|nr:ABC transporter permease [Clostridiales bacterium]
MVAVLYHLKKFFDIVPIFSHNQIKAKLEYRGALLIDSLFYILGYGTQFIILYLITDKFDAIGGWRQYEVLLLYSMTILTYTIACTLLRGPSSQLPEKIKEGHFDQSLIKPIHPLAYEIAASFSGYFLIHDILGIIFVSYSLYMLHVEMNLIKFIFLVCTILGGAMIQGGVLLLFAAVSFYILGENPLTYGFFIALRQLSESPVTIFPRIIQYLVTFIIPFAFICFYPSQYLLGKNDFLMFHPIVQFLPLPIGVIVLSVGCMVWSHGINRYQSSGN